MNWQLIITGFQFNNFCTRVASGNAAKTLYKYLLRQTEKLPKGPKEFYQFSIRQSFKQHIKETDQSRIDEIIKRSYEDADWVLKKYLGNPK